jgi:plasmid stabilization system protein ParE
MKQQEKYMKSTFKIIWTSKALTDLKNIITYLEENWTVKEIQKFARLLDLQLNRLITHPFLFPESNKFKKIRKSVLTRQISIYYRVINNEIQIITLFDNRQNPKNLNKI